MVAAVPKKGRQQGKAWEKASGLSTAYDEKILHMIVWHPYYPWPDCRFR
jgi:hypothetical protein